MMNDDSFFSMNRLMEFSMGMAMANQMTRVMNQTLSQMTVPGAGIAMPTAAVTPYVVVDGKSVGPLTDKELLQLVDSGKVTKHTLAWLPGMISWQPIEQIPSVLKTLTLVPPPIPHTK